MKTSMGLSSLLRRISVMFALSCLSCDALQTKGDGGYVFVILSQANNWHLDTASTLADQILTQAKQFSMGCHIHLAVNDWPDNASWTYFPILERIKQLHDKNSTWVIVLEEWSLVRLKNLQLLLGKYRSSEPVFLGHGLHDAEETIIHHFDHVDEDKPFLFPDARAGFALSTTLALRLSQRWSDVSLQPKMDFTIDAPYEFSRFIQSAGTLLTHHGDFCLENSVNCAIVFMPNSSCKSLIQGNDIHFGVKTCHNFHEERLPVLKATWLKHAPNYALYSDVEDPTAGTVSLGIPNTKHGHCGKTVAIIRKAAELPSMEWLAIVDDDTILSVNRLLLHLSCYNSNDLVALGEKYGFHATYRHGYDYITGGGGMIFSRALVKQLAEPSVCNCPSNDTPDDMFLGMCLKGLSVPIVHSRLFHQGRPMDYPEKLLKYEKQVSFHKFWMVNPLAIYSEWLDNLYINTHEEL